MIPKSVLFYVSGHGFGHAVRAAEVIRALGERCRDIRIFVKTQAPAKLFGSLPALAVEVMPVEIDTGVVEKNGALHIDADATVARLAAFFDHCDELVASEVEFVRRERISFIVADIPFLAGEIAELANVPCIAIGNFAWDWIYEPYLSSISQGKSYLARIRHSYESMACYIRLPFSHDTQSFGKIVDVPLITRSVQHDRQSILRKLGVNINCQRSLVAYSMRSPTSLKELAHAASKARDRLFFYFQPPQDSMPENTRSVFFDEHLSFLDVVSVCDVVVSKLGYGILADCVSTQTAILFPPREGFREDEILVPAAHKYLRACGLSLDDYVSGNWEFHLKRIDSTPKPTAFPATDGATKCAEILSAQCGKA